MSFKKNVIFVCQVWHHSACCDFKIYINYFCLFIWHIIIDFLEIICFYTNIKIYKISYLLLESFLFCLLFISSIALRGVIVCLQMSKNKQRIKFIFVFIFYSIFQNLLSQGRGCIRLGRISRCLGCFPS